MTLMFHIKAAHTRLIVYTGRTAQFKNGQLPVQFRNVQLSPYTIQLNCRKKTVRVRQFVVKTTFLDEEIYYAVKRTA
jgi:hypothetical protein